MARRFGGARLIEWRGRQVSQQVREAAAEAINTTIRAAARRARSSRTGRAANIVVVDQATPESLNGRWGVPPEPQGDPFFELFHEVGTAYLPGDAAKRRAADEQYPKLTGRIRRRLG